eukprot:1966272-Pleurochrysis_carterae.AAC.1
MKGMKTTWKARTLPPPLPDPPLPLTRTHARAHALPRVRTRGGCAGHTCAAACVPRLSAARSRASACATSAASSLSVPPPPPPPPPSASCPGFNVSDALGGCARRRTRGLRGEGEEVGGGEHVGCVRTCVCARASVGRGGEGWVCCEVLMPETIRAGLEGAG